MSSLVRDVRYGLRMLRRRPGLSVVGALTIALGIAANTIVFSVVEATLFRPLPYEDPDRVAFVLGWDTRADQMRFSVPLADVADLRQATGSFEDVAAYAWWSANMTGAGGPERVQAYRVSANLFDLLGVKPALGRGLNPEDGREGAPPVVVLSHSLWAGRLAGDASLVGRDLHLDGEPYTVVGVMPAGFEFPQFNFKGDLWAPMPLPAAGIARGSGGSAVAVARLARGVTAGRAQAEAGAIAARLAAEHPATNAGLGFRVVSIREMLAGPARPAAILLAVAVGLVLLIACANVANLLIARSAERRMEFAIRSALGAGRATIVRQLIVESLLLSAVGAGLGLLLARWGLDLLVASIPGYVAQVMPSVLTIGLNPLVLAFTAGSAVIAGVLFGLVPAIQAGRAGTSSALKSGTRGSSHGERRRLRRLLILAEVSLSLVLLSGAGLMIRSFQMLMSIDPGFDPADVLVFDVSLPAHRYESPGSHAAFFASALEGVSTLPGVTAAGAVNRLPLSTSNTGTRFTIGSRPEPSPEEIPAADFRLVAPSYFEALRIPLDRGRRFRLADDASAAPVAIVNEALVRRHFPGEDPVGRVLHVGRSSFPQEGATIVGVVGDVRHVDLLTPPRPEIYLPMAQYPSSTMTIVLRAPGAASLATAVRARIQAIDPEQPIYNLEPMAALVSRSLFVQRFTMVLMSVFAGLALCLTAVGLFGVLSGVVARRSHEIGVRVALGASRAAIMRLVLLEGMGMTAAGLGIGLAASLGLARLAAGLLYGVGPADPVTFVSISTILLLVALLACWLPARRATRIDPIVALRSE